MMAEFGWAVEAGSVTELGGCLLVGRWSRVGEMVVRCAGLLAPDVFSKPYKEEEEKYNCYE
jgi:hypothetical protein